ncbi:MAG: ABC transporter permease [Chloroflexi bacterium]|nr:ABC transporter permease [Chloroflexota bacterium]
MILGSDAVGRDFFARVVYGARISMIVGITSVFIGLAAGVAIGLASAFYGGRIDLFLQRVVDGLMAFPALVLALVIVTVMGSGIVFAGAQLNVILAIAIILVPLAARVVRGTALSVKENTYVEAAKALGASDLEIMARHILPNITHAVIILGATFIGAAIIIEATLSFLGIGTDITQPSWGNMIAGARARFEAEPRLLWTPAIAMSLTILGFNLLGDALRDVWDPRLRGT